MNARPLSLCLLSVVLCGLPTRAQTEAKPEAAPADRSAQLEKRRQELLKRFDLNGDGRLDDKEKAAMKEAMKQEPVLHGEGDIGSLSAAPGEPGPGDNRFVKELLKRFDKDGDGKLDEAELTELIKSRGTGGPGAPGGWRREQMLKMFDKNGDSRLDDAERAAAEKFRAEQIKRFDRNGDGVLDAEERAAAMKALAAEHPELRPPAR